MAEYKIPTPIEETENALPVVAPRFPRFEDSFLKHNRNFADAASDWASTRFDALYLPDTEKPKIDAILRNDVMLRFHGESIATDTLPQVIELLHNSENYFYYTSGNRDVQKSKIKSIRPLIPDDVAGKELPPVVAQNKLKDARTVNNKIMQVAMATGGHVDTLMLIDDKVSNFFLLLSQYTRMPKNLVKSLRDEEILDYMNDSDFERLLHDIEDFSQINAATIQQFAFVYVPPSKPVGETQTLAVSPKRDFRVRLLMDAVNKANPNDRIPCTHIADQDVVKSNLPERYIGLVDVDGVMVSQQKVLTSREQELKDSLREQTTDVYTKAFGISPQEFLHFLQDVSNTKIVSVGLTEIHINKYSYRSEEGKQLWNLSVRYPAISKRNSLYINGIDTSSIQAVFSDLEIPEAIPEETSK